MERVVKALEELALGNLARAKEMFRAAGTGPTLAHGGAGMISRLIEARQDADEAKARANDLLVEVVEGILVTIIARAVGGDDARTSDVDVTDVEITITPRRVRVSARATALGAGMAGEELRLHNLFKRARWSWSHTGGYWSGRIYMEWSR